MCSPLRLKWGNRFDYETQNAFQHQRLMITPSSRDLESDTLNYLRLPLRKQNKFTTRGVPNEARLINRQV